MEQWEYLQVVFEHGGWWASDYIGKGSYGPGKGPDVTLALNRYGQEGWEVVAALGTDVFKCVMILKRRRP